MDSIIRHIEERERRKAEEAQDRHRRTRDELVRIKQELLGLATVHDLPAVIDDLDDWKRFEIRSMTHKTTFSVYPYHDDGAEVGVCIQTGTGRIMMSGTFVVLQGEDAVALFKRFVGIEAAT